MASTIGCPRGPERTRALLEEIAAGRRGVQLRAQVLAAKRGATREQVEEAFQEACLKAARRCRGQTMGQVYTWLRMATDSNVDDMRDRLKREVLVDHSAAEFQAVDASLAPPDEVLIKREERAELDELTVAILDRLAERERKIAMLHCHGLARKEIASHLGVTPRVVKRSVEEVLATSRDQLTRLVGYRVPRRPRADRALCLRAGGRRRREARAAASHDLRPLRRDV
jgi:RNA polymerase sigma factor (sigma-70 family)